MGFGKDSKNGSENLIFWICIKFRNENMNPHDKISNLDDGVKIFSYDQIFHFWSKNTSYEI